MYSSELWQFKQTSQEPDQVWTVTRERDVLLPCSVPPIPPSVHSDLARPNSTIESQAYCAHRRLRTLLNKLLAEACRPVVFPSIIGYLLGQMSWRPRCDDTSHPESEVFLRPIGHLAGSRMVNWRLRPGPASVPGTTILSPISRERTPPCDRIAGLLLPGTGTLLVPAGRPVTIRRDDHHVTGTGPRITILARAPRLRVALPTSGALRSAQEPWRGANGRAGTCWPQPTYTVV